ncbi:MAG: transporter [Pseudonocardiales bacterium]|nr:transporter [Jatrophihabitantaceae bacterium]MCW2602512.1 transporter [Pseudonocardiales bacterium]
MSKTQRAGDDGYDLRYAWLALTVVTMASTLVSLNGSTLTIALPDVVRHFDASSTVASWMVLVFGLASTCVMLACGWLADRIGRRLMYLWGLGLFTLTSLLLGLAPNVWVLLGLQVVQAVAEAMLLANSAVIVSSVFPARMLGRSLGIYMAGFSVASLLGPTVGGALVTSFGWRWVFWFNVPLGLACLVLGAFVLRPMPATRGPSRFDLRGNILLILGLGGFIIALSAVSTEGWSSPLVAIGGSFAVIFVPLFLWTQHRGTDPLLDLTVFRNRQFSLAIGAGMINATATSAVVILIALYFQAVEDSTALEAGLLVLPLAIAKVVSSLSVGLLTRRMEADAVAALGAAATTAGLVLLMIGTSRTSPYAFLALGLVVIGIGSGIFAPANAAASLQSAAPDQLGRINAVRLTVQNSAWLAGTALGLTLLTAPLPPEIQRAVFSGSVSELGSGAVDQLGRGYLLAFAVMAVLSVFAIVAGLVGRPDGAGSIGATPGGTTLDREPAQRRSRSPLGSGSPAARDSARSIGAPRRRRARAPH